MVAQRFVEKHILIQMPENLYEHFHQQRVKLTIHRNNPIIFRFTCSNMIQHMADLKVR